MALLASLLFFCPPLLLWAAIAAAAGAPAAVAPAGSPSGAPDGPAAAPAKWALLVGINNYKYPDRISPLAGSLNDVEDMRQVLIGKYNFPPENILILKDSQATHAAIISAIQTHLIAKAQAGDIVLFHYSGHGSQMKDVTGKMISGLDETIVPYDSRDPEGKVFDISGAELHPLLLKLASRTKNLTFVLDSCHSGTLVRGARVRSIAADTRTPPPLPADTSGTSRGVGVPKQQENAPRFAFISAATSKENAFEHFSDGSDHGALTYFLARQLRTAKPGATYRDVMDGVVGNVTGNYPAQHPSLEGAEADQYVFGDGTALARTYVTASPLDSKRVTLGIGQVQGATTGSVYDVYPAGSKKLGPPEAPLAKVQIAGVDALASQAQILSGGKVEIGSRAVEREHRYGNARMRVFFDGLDNSPALQSIRSAVEPLKYVEVVDKASLCNLQVRQAGANVLTLGPDATTLSPPVPADDPAVVDRVLTQLKLWAKWFNVLSIHNAQPEIELQFTLKGSQTRDPLAHVGKPDMGVVEGETIDAAISNRSERDVYLAMLDLSSDGSISVVYPADPGGRAVLKPGESVSKTFTTFLPKGRSSVVDILKVFASYKPVDLTPLTQGRIRGMSDESSEPDPLEELLMDSAGLSRGVAPALSKPLGLGTWTTAQRVLVVRRAH